MNPQRKILRDVVQRSGIPRQTLASDAGLSYAGIRAWVKGERQAQPDSLRKLAAGLRKRAATLQRLAEKLDALADRSDDQ